MVYFNRAQLQSYGLPLCRAAFSARIDKRISRRAASLEQVECSVRRGKVLAHRQPQLEAYQRMRLTSGAHVLTLPRSRQARQVQHSIPMPYALPQTLKPNGPRAAGAPAGAARRRRR